MSSYVLWMSWLCHTNRTVLSILELGKSMPSILLRAADRYAYTGCGSTAYCYLFYWGRANTYTQKKILSVENLSRANSWSLSSCACPAGSCPAVPVQLVPAQLECTSLRIATETRPTRNTTKQGVTSLA